MPFSPMPAVSTSWWGHVILGQVLSLCLTGAGIMTRELLARYSLDPIAGQGLVVYAVLAVIYWIFLIHLSVDYFGTRNIRKGIPMILPISLLDTAANTLLLKSYGLLSLATVALISTVSTPTVMVLSRVVLHSRYGLHNVLGALVAVLGAVGACMLDESGSPLTAAGGDGTQAGSAFATGVALCLTSAILYGASNVLTEKFLKQEGSTTEYMALNTSFCSIWSLLYMYAFATIVRWSISSSLMPCMTW